MEERKRRLDEAGRPSVDHRDYWTIKRLLINFVLVGLILGPIFILGVTSIAVLMYILLTMPPQIP